MQQMGIVISHIIFDSAMLNIPQQFNDVYAYTKDASHLHSNSHNFNSPQYVSNNQNISDNDDLSNHTHSSISQYYIDREDNIDQYSGGGSEDSINIYVNNIRFAVCIL